MFYILAAFFGVYLAGFVYFYVAAQHSGHGWVDATKYASIWPYVMISPLFEDRNDADH